MRISISILCLLVLSKNVLSADSDMEHPAGPLRPQAQSKAAQLTPRQKEQVAGIVNQTEKFCLNPRLPPNAGKTLKMITAWSADPAICSCTKEHLRQALTPEVLAYTDEQKAQFFQHFALNEQANCGVPILKAHIIESCEQFIGTAFDDMAPERRSKRLNELGYNDMNSMLQGSCACIRDEIKDITPRQWAESTLTRYQGYLKRKQTGMPVEAAPSTPLEEAMSHCAHPQRANMGK